MNTKQNEDVELVHIIGKNIYNGKYCAVSGTTGDYEIKKSEC